MCITKQKETAWQRYIPYDLNYIELWKSENHGNSENNVKEGRHKGINKWTTSFKTVRLYRMAL